MKNKSDIDNTVADYRLYGPSIEEFRHLVSYTSNYIKLKKKEILYSIGDSVESIYAVNVGSVKSQIKSPLGKKQVLGFYLPGNLVGFDGFAAERFQSEAIALEDTWVYELPIVRIEELCSESILLRKMMMRLVGQEIAFQQHLILALGRMQTDERLAAFLLRLACYFKSRGYSYCEYTLQMPKHDIANFLGIAPETLSRVFARFEQDGLLCIKGRELTILDRQGLQTIANGASLPAT